MTEGTKGELFEQLARVGKALGNSTRLELIELLTQGPRGVHEIAEAAGLNMTTASAHLQTLKRAGLVTASRDGTTIRYSLTDSDVAALFGCLADAATRHLTDVGAAARRYLGPEDTPCIDREELIRRTTLGNVLVLDVRPSLEYIAGHIPGAVSIPYAELPVRMGELPCDTDIVAYCRSAYCAFAHRAVRLLTGAGRRAVRLTDGILEWRQSGHPLLGSVE
ncbi:metalloregulator ArsR/SmtB family transcription factor [Streptomyces luteireticuli]|uniref:Metalloregulator ArsR/SmtB family transcription factor n=1 Tax=Streptomyces luteireticuli TaxID=173858 RepID=A0ABN0YBC9_9ACTN